MKTIYEILFYEFAIAWLFNLATNIKTKSKESLLNAWKIMFYMNIITVLITMEG